MNDVLLRLDTSRLPKPRSLEIQPRFVGGMRLVIELDTISAARKWATALGITLTDTDPHYRYLMLKQESGTTKRGELLVHVIGTEATTHEEQDARRVLQDAHRIVAEAVAR